MAEPENKKGISPVLIKTDGGYCMGGVVRCGRFAKWTVDGDCFCELHARGQVFRIVRERQ